MNDKWIKWTQRLMNLAHKGLQQAKDKDLLNLFSQINQITTEIMSSYSGIEDPKLDETLLDEYDYKTPKIDIRGVIFKDNKILLVKDDDGKWSLPGGWAEIGYTPKENIIKEVFEESGYHVAVQKILGIYDRNLHHPPYIHHLYKIYFLCEIIDPNKHQSEFESRFFCKDSLPELSEKRTNKEQLISFFDFEINPKFSFFD